LVGQTGPALRAWAVIDPAVASGTMALDAVGQGVVGVRPGHPLYIRPLRRAVVV
jgi:hypothetical protein